MADVIKKTTNKFTKGLVMDFSPENTQNEVLTHALNATLLTFNGNELSLQNDMGNGRVETAYLPEGYIPVGTCEYGGIIYIVSYNPLEDKSQIGCFPSPERNISSEELGIPTATVDRSKFQGFVGDKPTGDIKNLTQHVLLKSDNLNPGDKFLICAENSIYNERIADLWVDKDDKRYTDNPLDNPHGFELVENPIIALHVVSIEESGRIVYLNSDVRQYEVQNSSTVDDVTYDDVYKYHILGKLLPGASQVAKEDIDNYRSALSSGYSVFKSKTSGKLAILAELLTIDSYSVTHSIQPRKAFDENGEEYNVESSFDIVIHTEITPTITPENFNLAPKLQYYHLKHSQGYLHAVEGNNTITRTLFKEGVDRDTNKRVITKTLNSDFLNTNLSDIYTKNYNEPLNKTGQFNFPKIDTYHGRMQPVTDDIVNATTSNKVYTKFTEGKYHRLTKEQLIGDEDTMSTVEIQKAMEAFQAYYIDELQARFYYYDHEKAGYSKVDKTSQLEESYTYYVKTTSYDFTDAERNADKYKDKGIPLYKYSSEPKIATDNEINNTAVEKFQEQEVHTYLVVAPEDYEITEKLYYYDESARKYIELLGEPQDGVTYYELEIEVTFVSIGKEIDKDEYKGDIYYYPTKKDFIEADQSDLDMYWDFEKYTLSSTAPWGCPLVLYERKEKDDYRIATDSEILTFTETDLELFYKPEYVYVDNLGLFNDNTGQLFIVVPMDVYVSTSKFQPDPEINYIQGCDKPTSAHASKPGFPASGFPKDDPLILYTVADFIPQNLTKDDKTVIKQYEDLKLANIKIPRIIANEGNDLPFKYDYTLVPCMNFGRLDHLAVSNTVDFSKLHSFEQSDFTTWKYHIDDNHLRLTFGADVYDTYEDDKVDALILEFYDCWGFAGSLEISDKKSYSGIFTKVLPLNTAGVLSKNRIIGNRYSDKYKRNVNIKDNTSQTETYSSDDVFKFNDKSIEWIDAENGWQYTEGDSRQLSDEDNDCGALYSNLIYGVRTYLRRTKSSGYQFIPKKELFLFTLPIYNDYYYTVNDFSTLENPKLEMMLTYKMQDKSSKMVYDNGSSIINGYTSADNENINLYTSGSFSADRGSTLTATKYYKYVGTTDLYLEVGLLKDYQNLNLSYDSSLNKYFSCKLKLISDDNEQTTYTVGSSENLSLTPTEILSYGYNNYGQPLVDIKINTLSFANGTGDLELPHGNNSDFVNSNFITKTTSTPILINYNFVVGYTVDINNIIAKEIPATTVCALCHSDGVSYNYADFSIREDVDDGGVSTFMSDVMYYNEGTLEQENFGLCRQVKTTGKVTEQCGSITPVTTDAQVIKTAGKLNAGEPLKQVVPILGKLTFCQPHVHGFSDTNGVNMYWDSTKKKIGVPEEAGGWRITKDGWFGDSDYDDCWGIVPTMNLANEPRYNLVLNTKNSIVYNSEFISTTKGGTFSTTITSVDLNENKKGDVTVNMREFVGLTGTELTTFNKKLLQTFKNIYVYNPDYDSLQVNIGNVSINDKKPKFTSNILCVDSSFTFGTKTLNDFIYLGPVLMTTYLSRLQTYSENDNGVKLQLTTSTSEGTKLLKTITFVPGDTYCGTPDNHYLISSLTYNTPAPTELEDELAFKASSAIVVKHSDGTVSQINGTINKKAFYGFSPEIQKLIQLDVSNYEIKDDGTLVLTSNTTANETKNYTLHTNDWSSENSEMNQAIDYGYVFTETFEGANDATSEVELCARVYSYTNHMDATPIAVGPNSIIMAAQYYNSGYSESSTYGVYFNPQIFISKSKQGDYTYSVYNNNQKVRCYATLLDKNLISIYGATSKQCNLTDQSYATLHALASDNYGTIALKKPDGTYDTQMSISYYRSFEVNRLFRDNGTSIYPGNNITTTGGMWIYPEVYSDSNNGASSPGYDYENNWQNPSYGENPYNGDIVLYEIFFDGFDYELTRKTELASLLTGVIKTTQTSVNTYSEKPNNYTYDVKSKYRSARFKGTSLTINDLVYEPNPEGHRLFVKNGLCTYNDKYRGKIYYRVYSDGYDASWSHGDDYPYKNALYLYTGPCFDPNNL